MIENLADLNRVILTLLVTFTKHEDLILNLYTNTLPFDTGFVPNNEENIIPVGHTFRLIAVNCGGFILKTPKRANCESVHVMPEVFKLAFKEVELDE